MKTIKVIWSVIAIIWLGEIGINLSLSMSYAESAMQASQLYDEASNKILRIIAITLLLTLANEPADKLIDQLQQQTKRIDDVLSRLQLPPENPTASNTVTTQTAKEVEQTDSTVSAKLEQAALETSENTLCPKCGSPMQIRMATKGEHKGKQFYVCSNYPNCRGVLPV